MKLEASRHIPLRLLFFWSLVFALLVLGNPPRLFAQGGDSPPKPLAQGVRPLSQVETLTTDPLNVQKLLDEDKQRRLAGLPPRFAQPFSVKVTPTALGTWEKIAADRIVWRLQIHSPDALSINLGFTQYTMPLGGQLFLYTPDYKSIIGPFTEKDNEAHGQLWTPLLPGDQIVVEVSLPVDKVSDLALVLSSINHGYAEFGGSRQMASGSCNVDVVCPVADGWRDEIRSVGAYSLNGIYFCSGVLINNTARDLSPYFLTADHCNITDGPNGNAPTMVVYWNYENSTCRTPDGLESGQPGDGPLAQFNSGAMLRARYAASDMTLVELDDPIDLAYNPYWAGWDVTGTAPISAATIHHPGVEEKRISFDHDTTTITTYYNDNASENGTHIRIADWDLGTTEPGSSGSPLFNQDHRIVGQLHGGDAACGNDRPDWYGRLFVSWTGGGTPDTRLSDWLDPISSGATTLDGQDTEPDFDLNISPTSLDICTLDEDEAIYDIMVDAILGFSAPIMLTGSGAPANANINFSPGPIMVPGTSVFTISNMAASLPGSYGINIFGASLTKTHTNSVALNLFSEVPDSPNLIAPADGASSEAVLPTFTWNAVPQSATYFLEVATDATYNTTVYSATVSGTSHQAAIALSPNTTHYWRVQALNSCGAGITSASFSFTTTNQICRTPNLAIPDNHPGGISDSLIIADQVAIQDLNVFIQAEHTYVGDLTFALKHLDTGTNVTLIDRPGSPNTSFGCAEDNIEATLDDEATSAIEDACATTIPSISGAFTPNEPLALFNGENLKGVWQLTALDNAGQDTGRLVRWCLFPTTSQLTTPILSITKSGPAVSIAGEPITYTLTVTNAGVTATNVLITDNIPGGTSYFGGGTPGRNIVSWTIAELPGFGSTSQVSFAVSTAVSTLPAQHKTSHLNQTSQIVGGFEAQPGSWPWMASVQLAGFGPWCGGSLIHPKWVLTAAHCTDGFAAHNFSVVLARHNLTTTEGDKIAVAKIIQHAGFNPSTLDNDIALLQLITPSRQPTLDIARLSDTILFTEGITATVMGWGDLSQGGSSPDVLHQVSVPIVSNQACNSLASYGGRVTENMLCAGFANGGKDACQGDSGGPLVVPNAKNDGWLQAGIVSWGEGCAQPNKYGVYTNIARFESWITSVVGPAATIIVNEDYGVGADNSPFIPGKIPIITLLQQKQALPYMLYWPIVFK